MYYTMSIMNNKDEGRSWLDTSWDRFLVKGDELFKYMVENFESMFDVSMVRHLCIKSEGVNDLGSRELMETYNNEIQNETYKWLKKEHDTGNLFKKENWKPFRDRSLLTTMYNGYKRLFQFRQYYLQLVIDTSCELDMDECKYCLNDEDGICFQLILYGWRINDDDKNIQPYNNFPILPDNIMPEKYWNRK